MTDAIAILDFGSQYAQLIARRVREVQVYCELFPWNASAAQVTALKPRGYILSGGPASVYENGAPHIPAYVLESGQIVMEDTAKELAKDPRIEKAYLGT